MSTDLNMLVFTALLCLLLAFPPVLALILTKGINVAAGNREEEADLPEWAGRASRAHRNLLENLPIFAALVLVAHVAGVANETTALGATIFFWARLGHGVVYIAGEDANMYALDAKTGTQKWVTPLGRGRRPASSPGW